MKKYNCQLLVFCLLNFCSLTAQVKSFSANTVKAGLSYQNSPMGGSLAGERLNTDGLSLDIVGFESSNPKWYVSLFFEEGYGPNFIDDFNYIDDFNAKETYYGVKYGKGIGSILLYGLVSSNTYQATESNVPKRYYKSNGLDLGVGFKSLLGKKQNFTLGAELNIRRSLTISIGYLFMNL